jgi:[protein-PII] uridylyltransferase
MSTSFSEERKTILADERLQGLALCRALSALADRWLAKLLGDEADVALVAVGGYGRSELAPGSDLDVVLVHRGRRDVDELARRVWYPIWEEGIALDHSVKTVDEALVVAGKDLKAALGLLDARTIAGDSELGEALARRAREAWQRKPKKWMEALAEATALRHHRFGDVAFLLEPELKEGKGGLRDITGLRAVELALPSLPSLEPSFGEAAAMLLDVRVALHRTTEKGSDRLVLQQQPAVAEELGLPDVDTLMRFLSGAARTIAWASDDKWHRVESHLRGPSGRLAKRDRVMSEGVVLRDGEIVVTADAPMEDASLPVRVASAAAQTRAPIARATLERLRAEAAAPGDPWQSGTRDALAELFGTGVACIAPFEALDQYGLVMRLLPEWATVRSRVQHNPYHRFTVDRHLLEAAVQAAALTDRVSRPDLLLFGAWLHDLGKGSPGDHTEAGIALMTRIAPRMGFPPADIDVLIHLVRDHLLLADAATRRDIRDPATSAQVAAAVGDVTTLELLAALTEADSKATGETAWTNWKATLLDELVQRVADVLEGAQPAPRTRDLEPRLHALVEKARGRVLVEGEDDRVVVVAPDRPGLFCHLAGVLALQGLDVLGADVQSSDPATAVDEFRVSATHGDPPDWERFRENVVKVLDGRLALEARLADRARTYNTRLGGDDAVRTEPSVTLHNDASDDASVVEVRTRNAVGVLYRITRAFYDLRLDIRHAKVQTLGDEVIDSFYVVDQRGSKLDDEPRIAELRRAVLFELSRVDG